jgi:hypothetical protein
LIVIAFRSLSVIGRAQPNDVGAEEGWLASTDPTADSIAPSNTFSAAVEPVATPGPPPAEGGPNICRHRRAPPYYRVAARISAREKHVLAKLRLILSWGRSP